jgi:hypothetical protein
MYPVQIASAKRLWEANLHEPHLQGRQGAAPSIDASIVITVATSPCAIIAQPYDASDGDKIAHDSSEQLLASDVRRLQGGEHDGSASQAAVMAVRP